MEKKVMQTMKPKKQGVDIGELSRKYPAAK